MDDIVTALTVFLALAVLFAVIMTVMFCSAEHENRSLRKENELFRRLWNEEAAMQNRCMNAYAEMIHRTRRTPKQ